MSDTHRTAMVVKLTLSVTPEQAKALVQFCRKEAKDAYLTHCQRRESDGIRSLFDADLQESHAKEARLAIEWQYLADDIKEQSKAK